MLRSHPPLPPPHTHIPPPFCKLAKTKQKLLMVMDKRLRYYLKDSVLFTSSSLGCTLLPGSSALLQKSKCSEHHPSTSSPAVSTRSLNRKQLPVFILCAISISSFKSSLKTFLCSQTLSSFHLPGDACVLVCMCLCIWIFDFLLFNLTYVRVHV